MYNLIRHKVDFGLEACWRFTATGHGKSAGDGIGAVLKSTTRRATLSKNILLSTAKDFYEFCRNQQLETAKKVNRDSPAVHVFFLDADEIEKTKANILDFRVEELKKLRKKNISFILHNHIYLGKIQGIRSLHEFQPTDDTTIQCRLTSASTHIKTYSFK